jgi:hypothetical protein
MSDISEIVHEIERHKGVLLPDPQEMGIFSYKLFTGAHDQLGQLKYLLNRDTIWF